jgi:hypothetical protein
MNHIQVLRYIEGAVSGIAYSSGLVALSVFLVGSFRPQELHQPYVGDLAWLRTDTLGIVCFFLATIGLACSWFLRRVFEVNFQSATVGCAPGTIRLLFTVVARTLVVAGTTLVIYISINAVTHPFTLGMQATHLLSWPTEGLLRVISVIVVAFAVAIDRSLREPEIRKGDDLRSP